MSKVIPFQFETSTVRVIPDENGEPWFVAADICAVLEIINSRQALARLDDDEKGAHTVHTNGGPQDMTVINESGLYSLILTSRKPGAAPIKSAILAQVSDSKAILRALNDFEVPDDLPDLFVYAIRETETGRIKIGISRDPKERLKQMQTGNSQKLELVATRPATNRFKDERALHEDNDGLRIRGEWFEPRAAEAFIA